MSTRPYQIAALAALVLLGAARVAAERPSADSLLAGAERQAKRDHKNVLVFFDASW
jgi:hypothetical protein